MFNRFRPTLCFRATNDPERGFWLFVLGILRRATCSRRITHCSVTRLDHRMVRMYFRYKDTDYVSYLMIPYRSQEELEDPALIDHIAANPSLWIDSRTLVYPFSTNFLNLFPL